MAPPPAAAPDDEVDVSDGTPSTADALAADPSSDAPEATPSSDAPATERPPAAPPEQWLVLSVLHDDLCKACAAADVDEVTALLERVEAEAKGKLNLNLQSMNTGETPLVAACDGGSLDVVQLLIDYGAEPNKAHSKDGMTALHSAAGFNRVSIVKYLLAKGAKFDKADGDGQTPAQVAASFGHQEVVDVFELAETEKGMETLKVESLAGYEEDKQRRTLAERAKKEALELKNSAAQREEARQRREAQFAAQMDAHRASVNERRLSGYALGVGAPSVA